MRLAAIFSISFGLLFAACSAETITTSAPAPAPSSSVDPGGGDPSPVDPGTDETSTDAGTGTKNDAGDSGSNTDANVVPADILGTLTGSCGIVKAQLTTKSPSYDVNSLVFVTGESYDKASLSDDGDRMFDTANAGGSSVESEVMSLEVLRACEGAKLLKTETEIGYAPPDDAGPSTITDYLAEISGTKIGVSVTRVYKPSSQPAMTDTEVKNLLVKKLEGVNRSSVRVLPADKWSKQILHVFTANQAGTDAIGRVLPTIDAAVRADTILLVTQTKGGGFIYCNPDPPLGNECP